MTPERKKELQESANKLKEALVSYCFDHACGDEECEDCPIRLAYELVKEEEKNGYV